MRYFFILLLTKISLFAVSQGDLEKIEERNKNILFQDKERHEFELNNRENIPQSEEIKVLEIEDEEKLSKQSCFEIKKFIFHNNIALDDDTFSFIKSEYQGKCLTSKHLKNILNKINNEYIQKGYITSKAYLKDQDLSSKIL
nr:hypothetical protein [Campylobacterota bacterium]